MTELCYNFGIANVAHKGEQLMGAIGQFTLLDFSGEKSNMSFYAGDITAVSLPGFLTDFGQLRTAIEGITLGTMNKERWIGDDTLLSNTPPASPVAQREIKWLVTYQGNTSQKLFQMEIPTADLTIAGILVPGTDLADLTQAAMATFVTEFETIARTPDDDTETVNVISVRFVGRNL